MMHYRMGAVAAFRCRIFIFFWGLTFSIVGDIPYAKAAGEAPATAHRKTRVVYLVPGERMSGEDSAAVTWLAGDSAFAVKVSRAAGRPWERPACDVLWIHLPDSSQYGRLKDLPAVMKALRHFVGTSGRIVATGYAAFLPADLGLEPVRPTVRMDTLRNDWLWDKKGYHSFRGHPLLHNLFGGDYVWDATVDHILPIVGYFGTIWPKKGRVVAVEKSYVFLHGERKVAIEHRIGKGRILSLGGMILFARANNLRRNMEQFMENALRSTAGVKLGEPETFWTKPDPIPKTIHVASAPLAVMPQREFDAPHSNDLLLIRDSASGEMFDLAGRRALIMGKERGGIDEVWVHPLRILRDYQAGIVTNDSVLWLQQLRPRVEVRPESFVRMYTVGDLKITERLFASLDQAGGVVCYESNKPVRLRIHFRSDLRWMWPYDAQALGRLRYGYDSSLQALQVRDASGDFACLFGSNAKPGALLFGHYGSVGWSKGAPVGIPTTEHQVAFGAEYQVGVQNVERLTFVFAGTNEGTGACERDYRAIAGDPVAVHRAVAVHYRTLLERSVDIHSPDKEFDALYRWAIVGADRFVARTPGVGTGLLAGFATTARGWNGEQKISGRPGYAWYFGRDAAWSCFALDAYGDVATVKDQLQLYHSFQDRSGKIFHELSTSGVVHFDASDATPLYVMLAAHYMRASGDTVFIRKSWPHIEKAMNFLFSTDTDDDGLIENTDIGHGWVEPGGVLFGVHSEYYLAVLWAKALDAASTMAAVAKRPDLQERYSVSARRVKETLNSDFWLPSTNFMSHGKLRDGSFALEHTVFPAVGLIWSLVDQSKARYLLREYASSNFSTDWGVRGLSGASHYFNPRGYQEGAAWPLFTGWTALGEFAYGNSVQGFTHVKELMLIKKNWALGYVQEVMNGSVYRPSGVCFHQCWSETNILHPILEGLVGWNPDALNATALLSPKFPADWDSVRVSRLRVGETLLSVEMMRTTSKTVYILNRENGPPCTVSLTPEIPEGMSVKHVMVYGAREEPDRGKKDVSEQRCVTVKVERPVTVVLEHTGGIAMLPVIPRPAVGDSVRWHRILSSTWIDSAFVVEVEGRTGTTGNFPFRVFGSEKPVAPGFEIRRGPRQSEWELVVPFEPSPRGFIHKTATISLQTQGSPR